MSINLYFSSHYGEALTTPILRQLFAEADVVLIEHAFQDEGDLTLNLFNELTRQVSLSESARYLRKVRKMHKLHGQIMNRYTGREWFQIFDSCKPALNIEPSDSHITQKSLKCQRQILTLRKSQRTNTTHRRRRLLQEVQTPHNRSMKGFESYVGKCDWRRRGASPVGVGLTMDENLKPPLIR